MKKKFLLIIIILTKILIFSSFIFSNGEWHEKAVKEEEMQKILNPKPQQIQEFPQEEKIVENKSEKPQNKLEDFKIIFRNIGIVIILSIAFYFYSRLIIFKK